MKTRIFANTTTSNLQDVQVNSMKEVTTQVSVLRQHVMDWSVGYTKSIEEMVKSGGVRVESAPTHGNAGKHGKKDLAIWKLAEGVSKPDFRHWLDSVDTALEAVHGFDYPDLVLQQI